MAADLVFAVLDTEAQTDAVNIGLLAAGAVAIAGLVLYAAVQLRRHHRQTRERAAVEAARQRAALAAAARAGVAGPADKAFNDITRPVDDSRWQEILDAINGRDQ